MNSITEKSAAYLRSLRLAESPSQSSLINFGFSISPGGLSEERKVISIEEGKVAIYLAISSP